eukprot:TRINITY_DN181_c0_g1_i1.p1 TRINITY_DN181_c0_g1~~TRINITY_DN181_c0_g1_i1.p1  ORF type:complete len:298 (-),score=58.75 TRINITY_DN181_c0_g1_i1:1186-2025(-)
MKDSDQSVPHLNDPASADVHLIVEDGKTLYAHRSILEKRSAFFKDHIRSQKTLRATEPQNSSMSSDISVIHTGMNSSILLAILRFIYTSKLDIELTTAVELMHQAERFRIEELRKKSAEYIADHITFDNVVEIFISADRFQVKGLKKACLEMIRTNFQSISQHPGFQKLIAHPGLLRELTANLKCAEVPNVADRQIVSSPLATELPSCPPYFQVGNRLFMFGVHGTVRFFGRTKFDGGKNIWIGLETDLPVGSHDGMVDSVRYFQTRPKHGLFIGLSMI